MRYISLCLFLFLSFQMAFSQVRVRVVDGSTNESIPYANIDIAGKESQVSNAEGYFSIPESYEANASIEVSYLGYKGVSTTVDKIVSANNTVKLQPAIYEIDEVKVQRPEPNALMAEVRKALKENYKVTQDGVKNRLFMRNMDAFTPKVFEIEVTESTGFSKKALAQANTDIAAMISRVVKHAPKDYNDILMDEYKNDGQSKVNVIKAVRFKDERYATSADDLEKSFTEQMLKHLDTTKYYRIKSGWFGSKDTVSLRKDFKSEKSKKKAKQDQVTRLKANLSAFVAENLPTNTKYFQFIHDYDIYKYEYEGAVFTSSGELVYVVKFSPRKKRALYSGKMYVSAADFGLSRIDYALVPGKKIEGLNLKLILGVKFAENVAKGTLIYDRVVGEPYFLRYASVESGQYIYVKRPVKFIELTDKDRDVVEFEFKIEGDTYSKSELLNLSREDLSAAGYADAREHEYKYIDIKKYDPSLWKEYGAIEPVEEMKRLQIVD